VLLACLHGCSWNRDAGPVPQELLDCRRLTSRAVKASEYGRHDDAQKLLAQAVETCPTDSEARRHYAEALWRGGRTDEAAAQFDEALALAGPDAHLLTRRAELRAEQGNLEAAARDAETALDVDSQMPECWLLRARLRRQMGESHLALNDYCRVLALDPENRLALYESAELRWRLGQTAPAEGGLHNQYALASLHALLETYPHDQEPQHALELCGRVYHGLGRYSDAATAWQLAAQRGPATPELLYLLADAQLRSGRPLDALAAVGAAQTLAPLDPQGAELRRRIDLALRAHRESLR
jgi:tetratricopeptide (TPR) repeat protein